jgi:hypothetical protein
MSTSESQQRPEILIFGPQSLALSQASLDSLREQLLANDQLHWARRTLQSLSNDWLDLASEIPALGHYDGLSILQDLERWMETGKFSRASLPLPNVLLTPLVVVTHLSEYLSLKTKGFLSHQHPAETFGLCTGLLSAAAVSCATKLDQLVQYGAVSIRLAMLMGAIVDAKDASAEQDGQGKSLSVVSNSRGSGLTLENILEHYPEVSFTSKAR